MESFFSFAKIILMGEYAVLHGADAVCLPLKTGQKLLVDEAARGNIEWEWTCKSNVLASFVLDADTLEEKSVQQGDAGWAVRLVKLIRLQNPGFLKTRGCKLTFVNYFPPEWGLGSSSATISSLCRMAGVNPFTVNFTLMGGSGADIACTTAEKWFLYRNKLPLPGVWEIPLPYLFSENTFFVYSGKKQATASHLEDISGREAHYPVSWAQANNYVYRFIAAVTIPEMLKIVYDHELLIANAIGMTSIGYEFPDFPGKVKSLGAWGGDFFMAISQQDSGFVKEYFMKKGYDTVLSWQELTETAFF